MPPARPDGQTDGQFAAAIGSARCKETRKIGAGRKEHEEGEQHDARHERASRITEHVTHQSRFHQPCPQAVIGRILPRQVARDGVEIIGGLRRRNARLQLSQDPNIVHSTIRKKVRAVRIVRALDNGHPEVRP